MNAEAAALCEQSEIDQSHSDWWRNFLKGYHLWDDPAKPPLSVVDLFCGSGGFGLSAALAAACFGRRAVFTAIADTDVSATEVYARSLPVRRRISESLATIVDYSIDQDCGRASFDYPPELLHEALQAEAGKVDLLIAGPPCQGHSNLNNHTRRNDPRNDLFVATAAIAVALDAKAVVIENVPGVLRSHGEVVNLARKLFQAEGYAVADRVLRMDELGGWQRRARYFMIAVKNGRQDNLSDALMALASDEPRSTFQRRAPLYAHWAIADLADYQGNDLFNSAPVQGPENIRRINYLFDEGCYDLPLTERPDCHKDGTTYTAVYGRMHPDRAAPTITTGIGTPGQGRFIHPTRRRLITPHEAARIQSFPDGYGFGDPNGEASRKALAKWIGDAVPPYLGMVPVHTALSNLLEDEGTLPWDTP